MNSDWTKEKIKKKVKLLKNNEVYRLGDCILFEKSHMTIKKILEDSQYDNSILKLYHENDKKKNILEIILEVKDLLLVKPVEDEDVLVVHIRLGDDLKGRGLINPINFSFFCNTINKSNFKKVVLVTALHYGNCIDGTENSLYKNKTWSYNDENYNTNIEALFNLIQNLNKPVEIVSNDNSDIDLIYLALSKNLLTSNRTGKFSAFCQFIHNWYYNKGPPPPEIKRVKVMVEL